jgi:DNA repair protein RadD
LELAQGGTMKLRDYQQRNVDELRERFANGSKRVLFQSPTGSGKTVLFAHIVARAAALGNHVIILGHRQEIIDQISNALMDLGVEHGVIAAGHPETPKLKVQVASVATLVRRLDRLRLKTKLLIVDEAHHSVAGTWQKIIDAMPDAHLIGCTATPQRLDNKGLSDIFDTLVIGPSVIDLIEAGHLSKFTIHAPVHEPDLRGVNTRMGDFATDQLAKAMSDEIIIGSTVDDYAQICAGAPSIAFCVNIAHSQLVAERFAAAGYRAAHVDGKTPRDERRQLIAALGTGELQVLCNCGIISEGLDVPNITAVILLRPTQSLVLYLQMCGRVLRPAPGKQRALILDHAGNTRLFGPPDAPRAWSLDGSSAGGSGDSAVWCCHKCGVINLATNTVCRGCGTKRQITTAMWKALAAEMEVERQLIRLRKKPLEVELRRAAGSEYALRQLAMARGYDRDWVQDQMQAYQRLSPKQRDAIRRSNLGRPIEF